MFISIIIPVWNDEKFLNECLDACLDQDLSKDEYEIICVDDGSTDRTPEILREYAERYPNIRIITKQHGFVHGENRTMGFQASNGEFFWLVDHDDVIAPHALDELKRIVEEYPDYDRYAFPYYRFQTELTDAERTLMRSGELKTKYGVSGNDYYPWSSIMRTSYFRSHGILPGSLQIQEAGEFWGIAPFRIWGGDWAMMNECYEAGIRTFQTEGRPLYHYRIHAGQSISSSDYAAAKIRAEKRRNTVLMRGHRAWIQKQRYLELRKTDPDAAQKAVTDAVVRLRDIIRYASSMVEPWAWKDCLRRFRKKGVMFRRKPREYPLSLRARLKMLSRSERRNPKIVLGAILQYYSFTYLGANILYKLEGKKRRREAARIQNLAQNAGNNQ